MTIAARSAAANQWQAQTAPVYARLRAACAHPAAMQAALLRGYLRKNASTAFGRSHGFARIRSVAEFQARVPIGAPAAFEPFFERIAQGERSVLTADPVLRLIPTSGTQGTAKWIPCTRALLREFQRGLRPWLHDLLQSRPALRGGGMYWAVSPAGGEFAQRIAAIPVGFAADADYLGRADARCAAQMAVVPQELAKIEGLPAWRYATLRLLLGAPDLRLISVWNPSFLTLLTDALYPQAESLVADLAQGTLTPPEPLPADLQSSLAARVRPAPARAREVARILAKLDGTGADHPGRLWPRLTLISCWTDSWAQLALPDVQRRFPGVEIQGKGLLATEACVTVPLGAAPDPSAASAAAPEPAPVLAVQSHFFEFEDCVSGRVWSAHELQDGGEYQVIVTTGGGLYRYRLNDIVRVEGRLAAAPRLRFVGKSGGISDLCGEKLAPDHVAASLARAWSETSLCGNPTTALVFLAPQPSARPPRYAVYADRALPAGFLAALERQLQTNPYYRWARRVGQLARLSAMRLPAASAETYRRLRARRGPLATSKSPALERPADWPALLARDSAPDPAPVGAALRAYSCRDKI